MAAIVKANTLLNAGGLAVLKRDFAASNTGQINYQAEYVCLAQFAATNAVKFQSGATPPTPISPTLAELQLTRTPTLAYLDAETINGLTYFRATYTAGLANDVVITRSSEQRSISFVIDYDDNTPVVASFDYIANSVTVEGTNQTINVIYGSTGRVFNVNNITEAQVVNLQWPYLSRTTIESTSQRTNKLGETINSVTSSGVYQARDVPAPLQAATNPQQPPAPSTTTNSGVARIRFAGLNLYYGQNQSYGLIANPAAASAFADAFEERYS